MSTGDTADNGRGTRQPYDVLIVWADYHDQGLRSYLSADGRFGTVVSINGRYSTPSLSYVLQFDAVLTWTNWVYQNKNLWGDILKDYVDQGGGVVVPCFAHHGSTWNLGGKWQSYRYDPIYQQNAYSNTPSTSMGIVTQPSHPIMDGVSSLIAGNYFRTTVLNPGAQPLFYWVNGYIGCAVNEIGAGRTVGMNQWPGKDAGLHCDLIIANAVAWAAGAIAGIPTDVDLEPKSLNLESNGNYVQFKIYGFPENPEYTHYDIDTTTVKVQNVDADLKFGTINSNKYIGKCDRLLVEDAIGAPSQEMEVKITGELNDGTAFAGKAIIKAILN
jgi:hypothetical protein